jgi:hypothetical protein
MVYAVIPYQIYQPTRAGNLPIPAKPPVNRWDATLKNSYVTSFKSFLMSDLINNEGDYW